MNFGATGDPTRRILLPARAHDCLLAKNIPIGESLDMSHVEPGKYNVAGFPLKFISIDGSPARVVLISE